MQSKKYLRDGRSPIPQREITSRIMSSIKAKNTKPEMLFRKALNKQDLGGYRLHPKNVPGRPDICYITKRLAIFVHGCYWHRCPYCKPEMPKTHVRFWRQKFLANIKRDRKKEKELIKNGWRVVTVWECQIENKASRYVKAIKKVLVE
jgi:DNA mismatch endonuclease (patch repair protein)